MTSNIFIKGEREEKGRDESPYCSCSSIRISSSKIHDSFENSLVLCFKGCEIRIFIFLAKSAPPPPTTYKGKIECDDQLRYENVSHRERDFPCTSSSIKNVILHFYCKFYLLSEYQTAFPPKTGQKLNKNGERKSLEI